MSDLLSPGVSVSGAVALMDVAIDDQDAVTLLRQPRRGDGQIVEHAVARAGIGQGMVAATGGVGRIAVLSASRAAR